MLCFCIFIFITSHERLRRPSLDVFYIINLYIIPIHMISLDFLQFALIRSLESISFSL